MTYTTLLTTNLQYVRNVRRDHSQGVVYSQVFLCISTGHFYLFKELKPICMSEADHGTDCSDDLLLLPPSC